MSPAQGQRLLLDSFYRAATVALVGVVVLVAAGVVEVFVVGMTVGAVVVAGVAVAVMAVGGDFGLSYLSASMSFRQNVYAHSDSSKPTLGRS